MTPNYPRNCWYVAATSDELGRTPLGRRLLDRDVVLYRLQSGAPVALADRCAHRAMPLSTGRLDGDRIVCGYHGFTYDRAGQCVRIPSQPNVPAGTSVGAYPVLEQPPFVWIWLGRPEGAAGARPPRTPWLGNPGWAEFGSSRHVAANFMLLHEHYLDFTHVFELHPEQAPVPAEALPSLDEIEVSETSVSYTRSIPAALWPTGRPRRPGWTDPAATAGARAGASSPPRCMSSAGRSRATTEPPSPTSGSRRSRRRAPPAPTSSCAEHTITRQTATSSPSTSRPWCRTSPTATSRCSS